MVQEMINKLFKCGFYVAIKGSPRFCLVSFNLVAVPRASLIHFNMRGHCFVLEHRWREMHLAKLAESMFLF